MDLTSRKFWIAVGSIVIISVLCFLGKIDGTQLVAGLGVIYGFYSAGNIMDKVVDK